MERHGRHSVLKPDAYCTVVLGDFEDRWFLEVDRGTEDLGRIGRKLLSYVDYWQSGREPVLPRVLWVVDRAARRSAIARTLTSLPVETRPLFRVCAVEAFGDVIAAGAGGVERNHQYAKEVSHPDTTPQHQPRAQAPRSWRGAVARSCIGRHAAAGQDPLAAQPAGA